MISELTPLCFIGYDYIQIIDELDEKVNSSLSPYIIESFKRTTITLQRGLLSYKSARDTLRVARCTNSHVSRLNVFLSISI